MKGDRLTRSQGLVAPQLREATGVRRQGQAGSHAKAHAKGLGIRSRPTICTPIPATSERGLWVLAALLLVLGTLSPLARA